MANPHRGETRLKAGDTVYTLVFNTNAACKLESELGTGIAEIVPKMGRLTVLRALLWAALLEHHKLSTPEDAGPIMDEAGATPTIQAINHALTLAFGSASAGATRKNQ